MESLTLERQLALTGSQRSHPWKAQEDIWADGFIQNFYYYYYLLLFELLWGMRRRFAVLGIRVASLSLPLLVTKSGHWRNSESEGHRGL
jgi:hypothetical protein